jgi:hypothetical protein
MVKEMVARFEIGLKEKHQYLKRWWIHFKLFGVVIICHSILIETKN